MRGISFLSSLLLSISLTATAATTLKQRMLNEFESIFNSFDVGYAPKEWKKAEMGFDLYAKADEVRQKINSQDLTVPQYQRLVSDFVLSTKDYHVSIRFLSTEKASLPFSVLEAKGRFFIAYVDRKKLTKTTFPYDVGDELLLMNGRPVNDIVKELTTPLGGNRAETDRALATMYLTKRSKRFYSDIPSGPMELLIAQKKDGAKKKFQIIWDYTPEKVNFVNNGLTPKFPTLNLNPLERRSMEVDRFNDFAEVFNAAEDPTGLGNRASVLPALGEEVAFEGGAAFNAKVYKMVDGKKVGFIRIPSYSEQSPALFATLFQMMVSSLEKQTDMLVIDQMNNPGGSVFYLYQLASILADQPLKTPLHEMSLTTSDIQDTIAILDVLPRINDDDTAKAVLGQSASGYPVTYEFSKFLLGFYNFLLSEWNAGKRLTTPFYLYGVDHINPSASNYSKPILILTNALDFSGGDFFPAIMQDNGRATIMGANTAGAGGYVLQAEMPSSLGLQGFRYTASHAIRANGQPIENLGVAPDVPYSLTANDLQNEYADFTIAIKAQIYSMLRQAELKAEGNK